eukprot:jgi/Galph1/4073/GphlegSOOS_G2745.1
MLAFVSFYNTITSSRTKSYCFRKPSIFQSYKQKKHLVYTEILRIRWTSSVVSRSEETFTTRTLHPENTTGAIAEQKQTKLRPVVPILMGSSGDLERCQKIAAACMKLGLDAELRIASAHKIPERLLDIVKNYEADPRPKVKAPVISCPPYSDAFGGSDIFSSIRMPSGVAPAFISEPETYIPIIRAQRSKCVSMTSLPGNLVRRQGKVRDQYEGKDYLILITTDRQSAFDRVLASVPFKGQVLNKTSAWWFEHTQHIVPNHLVAVPHPCVTIAKKCQPFPIEFVVRGYITGSTGTHESSQFTFSNSNWHIIETSLWKNYEKGVRNYCGIAFPNGLKKNEKLHENVLTPTTKDEEADRPISPNEIIAEQWMTREDFEYCQRAALELFAFGQKVAKEHGLILVDSKYEFGKDKDGNILLIDEIHTPDSSRYWLSHSYEERMKQGKEPENVDKEFLRLWFRDNCDPYHDKVLPEAPEDLVVELSRRYIMLYELITWQNFELEDSAPDTLWEAVKPFL